jgi:hypothetical protein
MIAWIAVKSVIAVALILILAGLSLSTILGHLTIPWLIGMTTGMIAGAAIGVLERLIVV